MTCFVVAGFLPRRGRRGSASPARSPRKELYEGQGHQEGAGRSSDVDPEMAEIEALLRKRGIT